VSVFDVRISKEEGALEVRWQRFVVEPVRRTVVDDDDLVVVGIRAALKVGARASKESGGAATR
jgi:hypothetical protein